MSDAHSTLVERHASNFMVVIRYYLIDEKAVWLEMPEGMAVFSQAAGKGIYSTCNIQPYYLLK